MLFSPIFISLILGLSPFIALMTVIIIHEFSHAYMADRLGDPTPRIAGRITLNPIAHIDPVGTILVPLFLFITQSPLLFGWAKPVPFDLFNLKNPRRDAALISLAGPGSNIVLAIITSALLRILITYSIPFPLGFGVIILGFLKQLIILNIVIAVFNLIPVHPLDGFKIVWGMLSEEKAREWAELKRYGMIFLIFLIFPFGGVSPIFRFLGPVINIFLNLLIPEAPLV